MKKTLTILLLSLSFLSAKKQELLDLQVPSESYVNLSEESCNETCLLELLQSGLYLSFLSQFVETGNQLLSNIHAKLLNSITDFDKNLQKTSSVKLALIIPEKTIKNYTNTIINSSIAYLLRQRAQIGIRVFLIGTEDSAKINEALQKIEAQNYQYVIAGLTTKGVIALENYSGKLKIFIPTVHKNDSPIQHENIHFGGIDYDAQIATLLKFAQSAQIAAFGDGSSLSNALNAKLSAQEPSANIYSLAADKIDFARLLRSQGSLNQDSIFLNTPLIKTALVSSQLRIYNVRPHILLSTQINYNPALLSLTQPNDRKKLLIANSIANGDENLSYLNEIFSQSLDYNWVAYATSVGVDYFYANFLSKNERIFEEKMENSQIIYKVRIMKALEANFEELK